ncbi:MAG: S41 family peptidase [Mucilaginibacter sp.]
MRKLLYLTLILSAGLLAACKKEKKNPIVTGPTTTGSTLDLIKDSVYLYFKEENLWHSAAPDYATFNPRAITGTNDIGALQTELDKLSQYAINPATGKPYEYSTSHPGYAKYSFIDDGTTAAALNGTKGDFGLGAIYNQVSDLRIKYVYPGSPAALAGIRRGYQIMSINGSTNIAYDGGTGPGTNLAMVNNAIFNSTSISMTLKKYDGTTLTVNNMSVASYTVNPVLKDTVYTTANGHKVGYIVFNSFTSGSNATPKLNAAFDYFTAQGVTDLVVDLRYNGGGYVSTAEYLSNLIVPASKSGTLMYNTYYTDNMVNRTDPLLGHQWRRDPSSGTDYNYAQFDYTVASNGVNFSKQHALNVSRVFFIVTGSTASASELTINNLRPVMDVQFIGRKSYGKPVGFFDIDINKYIMYTPEFSTKNSAGQGDYYDGFNPGDTGYPGVNDYDDPTKDFGDPTEGLLAHVLHFVTLGTYSVQNPVTQGIGTKTLRVQQSGDMGLNPHDFNGMIFDKKLKLKK